MPELNLAANQLRFLPPEIGDLKALDELNVQNNELEELPPSIMHLENLPALHLHGNELKCLPSTFGHLPQLEYLNASSNYLTTLPESFKKLKTLKRCHLASNQFKIFPKEFGLLPVLERLDLEDNPLVTVSKNLFNLKGCDIALTGSAFSPILSSHIKILMIEGKLQGSFAYTKSKVKEVDLQTLFQEFVQITEMSPQEAERIRKKLKKDPLMKANLISWISNLQAPQHH